MATNSHPKFRISSALKNLIGKELITDEFIAIFELVKNSFDANAKRSTIVFENLDSKHARIVILDDGKGMTLDDLLNKWLFVAYSAKKDGTEDYRDKIKSKRIFAGAKGVGRFSCDRLGSKLNLITIKNKQNASIENLEVDWEKFEVDSNVEFINIETNHKTLKKIDYRLRHGTILEISNLRDNWNRDRILKLKHSLEKLVNPDKNNQAKDFQIEIICKEEYANDTKEKEDRLKVNGIIRNLIFQKLETKTTRIESSISPDGNIITTKLTDRGSWIYTIKENNPYLIDKKGSNSFLKNVSIKLFQLNRAAKKNFTTDMGIEPVKYGSVFMYKNDFRIYPFGEEGDDSLQIDRRKAQGYSRFLGTRDVLGRIEINGVNNDLVESTSRDGGLIKNRQLENLVTYFYDKAFTRLENYVVDIIEWGDDRIFELEEKINVPGLTPSDVKKEIIEYIKKISKAKNVISVEYDKKFFSILEEKAGKSINKSLREFAKKAKNRKDGEAYAEAIKLKTEFKRITSDTKKAEFKAEKAVKELEKKKEQLAIHESIEAQDIENVTNLHHQVFVIADTVKSILKEMYNKITLDDGEITKVELIQFMDELISENKKIESLSRFGMRAIFEDFNSKKENDISEFLGDYVSKISNYFKTNKIKVDYKSLSSRSFKALFRPLDISIIIDNIINNSKKHKATQLSIITESFPSKFEIIFRDNGVGFNKEITDINEIFKKGFSTTKSTGLGLYHINNIIKEYKWSITVNTNYKKGAEFIITIKK